MDAEKYLERIGYGAETTPTLKTLSALQTAHMRTVPFENLSVYYKQPIILNKAALYKKIVEQKRGGFCYELNGLFAWLLRLLGYTVEMLSAGVVTEGGGFGPEFDHMTLLVHLDEDYLVDVGFGDSFQEPLRVNFRGEQRQGGMSYQLSAESEALVYSEKNNRDENPVFQPQYRFTLHPHLLKDYEGMCRYHQTSPKSSFTRKRVCSRATPNGRYTLSDMRFIITQDNLKNERELKTEEEVKNILWQYFLIAL